MRRRAWDVPNGTGKSAHDTNLQGNELVVARAEFSLLERSPEVVQIFFKNGNFAVRAPSRKGFQDEAAIEREQKRYLSAPAKAI